MNIEANSMIRDYRILRKLGEGGMGTVYLAEDTMLERKVAIKILNPVLTEDPQFVERFRSEAKVQSRLVHPHIASLHTFFIEEGCYCIVMEYAEGQTLKTLIENLLGRMPEERALRIFDQILQAVGYAHSKGIVHRDLKPSNIIVDADDHVKVMDFGIAKILGEKGLTRTGAKIGTLYYMSPEQVRAQKDIDQRSDIYSLAIILYEMLTKRLPFNADTESDFEVMQEIVEREIPPLEQLAPEVSRATEAALVAAAAKDREARLQNCQAFMNALAGRLPPPNQQHSFPAAERQPAFQSDASNRIRPSTSAGAPFIPNAELTGVNGWLLFFCIILTLLVPLQVLIGIINFKASFELWDHFTSESSENVYLPVRLQMIVMAGLAVWGLFTGIGLWRRAAGAVQRVRTFLKMNMILSILASLMPLFFLKIKSGSWDQIFGILSFGAVSNIVYFIIWNSYFAKSKRVANTYGEAAVLGQSASSSAARGIGLSAAAPVLSTTDQIRSVLQSKEQFSSFIANRKALIILAAVALILIMSNDLIDLPFKVVFAMILFSCWLLADLLLGSGLITGVDRSRKWLYQAALGAGTGLILLGVPLLFKYAAYSFFEDEDLLQLFIGLGAGIAIFILTGMALDREEGADRVFRGVFGNRIFADRFAVWYAAVYLGVSVIMLVKRSLMYGFLTVYQLLFALSQLGLVICLHNLLAGRVKLIRLISLWGLAAAMVGIFSGLGSFLDSYEVYRTLTLFGFSFTLLSAVWLIWLGVAMRAAEPMSDFLSIATIILGLVLLAYSTPFWGNLLNSENQMVSFMLPGIRCVWASALLVFMLKERQQA